MSTSQTSSIEPRPPPDEQLLAGHQVVAGDEAARLAPLAAEGPDDAHAAEGFGRLAVDVLPLRADVAIQRPDAVDPGAMRHIDRRQRASRPPSIIRQSTQASTIRLPTSWMMARQGL